MITPSEVVALPVCSVIGISQSVDEGNPHADRNPRGDGSFRRGDAITPVTLEDRVADRRAGSARLELPADFYR
jgi:hypothetical protein